MRYENLFQTNVSKIYKMNVYRNLIPKILWDEQMSCMKNKDQMHILKTININGFAAKLQHSNLSNICLNQTFIFTAS